MRLREYLEMGGHKEKIRKLKDVLKEIKKISEIPKSKYR
jgi:hypothetical protein